MLNPFSLRTDRKVEGEPFPHSRMDNKNIIVPALTAFIVGGFLLFLSCANQERADNDGLNELAEEVAGGLEDSMPDDNSSGGKEKSGAKSDDLGGEDLAALGISDDLPSEEQLASASNGSKSAAKSKDLPVDKDLDQTFSGDASADGSLVNDDVLGLPSDEELAAAPEPGGDDASTLDEFGGMKKSKKKKKSRHASAGSSSWSGQSSVPSIPSQAIQKAGANLNRFYFLRINDTPQSVSELIYGSRAKEKALKSWNRGSWSPGKVIYYSSAQSPGDEQMNSFYRERNLSPEEYVVKKGDLLSLVAKTKLGHINSWKEIAALNGLSSADAVELGQRLVIYTNLGGRAVPPPPVVEHSPKPMNTAEASPDTPPPPTGSAGIQEDIPPQFSPPPPVQEKIKQGRLSKKRFSINFQKMVQQNMIPIAIGCLILLLLGALIVLNRKKRSRPLAEELSEDIFDDNIRKK